MEIKVGEVTIKDIKTNEVTVSKTFEIPEGVSFADFMVELTKKGLLT